MMEVGVVSASNQNYAYAFKYQGFCYIMKIQCFFSYNKFSEQNLHKNLIRNKNKKGFSLFRFESYGGNKPLKSRSNKTIWSNPYLMPIPSKFLHWLFRLLLFLNHETTPQCMLAWSSSDFSDLSLKPYSRIYFATTLRYTTYSISC